MHRMRIIISAKTPGTHRIHIYYMEQCENANVFLHISPIFYSFGVAMDFFVGKWYIM